MILYDAFTELSLKKRFWDGRKKGKRTFLYSDMVGK
jgi:hypothetical protein